MLGAFAEAMMWAQASMHRDADYRGTLRRAEELPQPVAAPADGTLGRAPSTWWPEVALLGPTKLYTPSKKER
jgi:hypothetical protein